MDDGVHALARGERVLDLVGIGREPVAQQVLEQELTEAAARLGRPERLLEPAEILRALDHLRGRLGHFAEALVDLRRRLTGGGEAPVDRLGDAGQPAVDVGAALAQLTRRLLAEASSVRPQRRELLLHEPREQDEADREDGGEKADEEADDHWADER